VESRVTIRSTPNRMQEETSNNERYEFAIKLSKAKGKPCADCTHKEKVQGDCAMQHPDTPKDNVCETWLKKEMDFEVYLVHVEPKFKLQGTMTFEELYNMF